MQAPHPYGLRRPSKGKEPAPTDNESLNPRKNRLQHENLAAPGPNMAQASRSPLTPLSLSPSPLVLVTPTVIDSWQSLLAQDYAFTQFTTTMPHHDHLIQTDISEKNYDADQQTMPPTPAQTFCVLGTERGRSMLCPLSDLQPGIHYDLLRSCNFVFQNLYTLSTTHAPDHLPYANMCKTAIHIIQTPRNQMSPVSLHDDFIEFALLHVPKNTVVDPNKNRY